MKILCVGRNYVEHAKELSNPVPKQPLIFMKPPSALLVNNKPFYYPSFTENLHYEVEVVLKICKNGRPCPKGICARLLQSNWAWVDFTARDLQGELKKKGHPWEIAKGFDGSAALSEFIGIDRFNRSGIEFELRKNEKVVQKGNTKDMILPLRTLSCMFPSFLSYRWETSFIQGPQLVLACCYWRSIRWIFTRKK